MINGIGIWIGNTVLVGSGSPYTSEYQAILNQALTLGYSVPDETQRNKDNTAIVNLKSNGIWDQLDLFYGMTGNTNFATLNWKNPTQYQLTLINSPSYNTTLGFTGNGTTSYLSTNWQPNVGVNFTQNVSGFGGYNTNELNDTSVLFGASNSDSTSACYLQPRTSNMTVIRINQGTNTQVANSISIGRFHVKRVSSSSVTIYKNATQIQTGTPTSQARTSATMMLLARDAGGSIINFSLRSIRNFWTGSSLNGLESTMDTIIQSIYA